MTDEPSSEPKWVTIKDGSDRVWKQISMYELRCLEYAINEDEPGHLKELHDSGNNIIDRVRSRTVSNPQAEREKVLDDLNELAEHYYRQYLDGDPYLEKRDFKRMIDELRSNKEEQP